MILSTGQMTNGREHRSNKVRVCVQIDTEVLSPITARRKANLWLAMHAGNLLRADEPELILEAEQLLWRCDVLLTRIEHGVIGKLGRVHLYAITGEVMEEPSVAQTFLMNAITLLQQKGLPVFTDLEDAPLHVEE